MKGFSILKVNGEAVGMRAAKNQGNGIRQRHFFIKQKKKTVIDAQIGNKIGILDFVGIIGRQIKPQEKILFSCGDPNIENVGLALVFQTQQILPGRMR